MQEAAVRTHASKVCWSRIVSDADERSIQRGLDPKRAMVAMRCG